MTGSLGSEKSASTKESTVDGNQAGTLTLSSDSRSGTKDLGTYQCDWQNYNPVECTTFLQDVHEPTLGIPIPGSWKETEVSVQPPTSSRN
ncbi:uncharacterized protein L201_002892 [Kwoniella dendrophila CBS 6074]|uniref:Ig-like domain-containing protein n=1 Tax=Kwoniella dendrophila CBS 6074 TaxID=1295534 RepID=A0AAX4JTW5_9TREE